MRSLFWCPIFGVFLYKKKRKMIYTTTAGAQVVKIPRNVSDLPDGEYRLAMRNNIGRGEVELSNEFGEFNDDFSLDFSITTGNSVIDTTLYHIVEWMWPRVPTMGEYTYTLYKGDVVVARGLMIVTEEREMGQYDKAVKYEQYEG